MLGVLAAAIGIPLVLGAPRIAELHPNASGGLSLLGWYLTLAAVWLVFYPRGYQTLANSMVSLVSDRSVLRVFGVIGTAIGVALGWLAWTIR